VILCLLYAWFTAFTVTQRELDLEEPDAGILHVRICGSPSGVIPGATRQLLFQAHVILQANAEVAENPHETRGTAHCAQLWSEIVGNRSPLGSLEFQRF
jgi:hypothetical protein